MQKPIRSGASVALRSSLLRALCAATMCGAALCAATGCSSSTPSPSPSLLVTGRAITPAGTAIGPLGGMPLGIGVSPTGLALSPSETTLFATLGDFNAVAVIDSQTMKLSGYIPAGWYPTALAITPDNQSEAA